jgi:hypothetical protein
MSSDKIIPISKQVADLQNAAAGAGVRGDGGAAGDDGRLARIEAQIAAMDRRTDDLKGLIEKLDERALTKWDVAQVVFYVVGAIMAAIVLGPRLAPLLTP